MKISINNPIDFIGIVMGICISLVSPFFLLFIISCIQGPTIYSSYSFKFDTMQEKTNNLSIDSISLESSSGFDDISLNVSFFYKDNIRDNKSNNSDIVFSFDIRDYETSKILYTAKNIYSPISSYSYLSNGNYFHRTNIEIKGINLKNNKYIFKMKYYATGASKTIYEYTSVIEPTYYEWKYILFDSFISLV